MANLTNVLINAATISALYALIAIGFTLIFGVGNILNFAHGGVITVGAFAGYLVSNPSEMALNPLVGLSAAVATGAVVGALMYWGVVRFIEDRPVALTILTFVIGFGLQHATRIFVTPNPIAIPQLVEGQTMVLGQSKQTMRLVIFVLSWFVILGVFYFVNRTKTGKGILATSMSKKGASLVGIDSSRLNLYTWVMASAFAAMAGVLLTMLNTGDWQMGTEPLVLSFSIVILGGLGSIRGSVVGAYVIGFVETITTSYIDPTLTGLASLLLLIAFLLAKPEGLFGREAAE